METIAQPAGHQGPPAVPGHDAVRCLGSGSQGQVWLLSPHNGSSPVAAKFLGPDDAHEAPGMIPSSRRHNESQLTSEWRVLTRFRHEHLIAVHGMVRDEEGSQVLLMDFAAGGSLSQVIAARGALSVGETVTILTPIGQVLAFLHGQGAVHGDVAPGNILLTAAGKPVLSDFGLGRLLGQEEGAAQGTPGFRCLEDTVRDEAGDVYALAAVGWFALTGRVAPRTRERPPLSSLVPEVPSELMAALEAGLNEDAALRPTAAALAQAVFRSAPAQALALGNAVHPSVLPLLPTYHEPAGRGRPGKRRAGAHVPGRTADVKGPRQTRPTKVPWTRLLGGPARAGTTRRAGTRGSPKRTWGPLLVAGMGLLAVVAVLGSMVLGGVWADAGAEEQQAGQGGQPGAGDSSGELVAGQVPGADMSWAAALPHEIQEGVQAKEPVTALHALAWLRSFALSNANQNLVEHLNVAGSPALAADTSTVTELVTRGHTLTGFESRIVEATTLRTSPPTPDPGGPEDGSGQGQPLEGGTAVVRATVHSGAFAEQNAAGELVHRQEHERNQVLDFVLLRTGAMWRIGQVLAVENK